MAIDLSTNRYPIYEITPHVGFADFLFDASTKRGLCLFTADRSASMLGFVMRCHSIGGTPTNAFQADLYAVDANLYPTGSSLASVTVTPTSANQTFTWGTPYSVVQGTTYAVVIQNVHATPASNLWRTSPICLPGAYAGNTFYTSTDSGTTYVLPSNSSYPQLSAAFWPNYSGGTVGLAASGVQGSAVTALSFYNVSGSRVSRLANKYNFKRARKLLGVRIIVSSAKVGTPTYKIVAEVCSASASLATSIALLGVSSNNFTSSQPTFWFTTPYDLLANTDYYIGFTPEGVNDGTSSNYFRLACSNTAPYYPTLSDLGTEVYEGYSSTAVTPSWSAITATIAMSLLVTEPVSGGILVPGGMTGGFNLGAHP